MKKKPTATDYLKACEETAKKNGISKRKAEKCDAANDPLCDDCPFWNK